MSAQGQWDPLKELTAVQKRMNKLFESALGMADFDTRPRSPTLGPGV